MSLNFKDKARDFVVQGLGFGILIAITLAGLLWFFGGVVFGFTLWPYWLMVRYTYIAVVIFALIDGTRCYFVTKHRIRKYAIKWTVPPEQIERAVFVLGMDSIPGFVWWNAEQFKKWYTTEEFVHRTMSALFG